MMIERKKRWYLYVGRGFYQNARLVIEFGHGYREDAQEGEIQWRRSWVLSSRSLPQLLWRGWQPIGYRAFGHCRVWA